jgi:nucleoside 2-deoxyribosyltransferase
MEKTKKIYIAYKFKEQNPVKLKAKLEKLSKIIEDSTEHKTFVFFRDAQNWGEKKMNIKEVVEKAMEFLKECDALLIEASEKANGIYFEAGYAKALGKKVIVIHKQGTEANFLESSSDISLEYTDFEDLKEKLKRVV